MAIPQPPALGVQQEVRRQGSLLLVRTEATGGAKGRITTQLLAGTHVLVRRDVPFDARGSAAVIQDLMQLHQRSLLREVEAGAHDDGIRNWTASKDDPWRARPVPGETWESMFDSPGSAGTPVTQLASKRGGEAPSRVPTAWDGAAAAPQAAVVVSDMRMSAPPEPASSRPPQAPPAAAPVSSSPPAAPKDATSTPPEAQAVAAAAQPPTPAPATAGPVFLLTKGVPENRLYALHVHLKDPAAFFQACLLPASGQDIPTGIYVENIQDLPLGEPMPVHLLFDHGPVRIFDVGGKVAWRRVKGAGKLLPGMAVEFLPDEKDAVSRLVATLKAPQGAKNRRHRRLHAVCNVKLVDGEGRSRKEKSNDVSEGGLFLLTADLLQVGEHVTLHLKAPGALLGVEVPGRVTWHRAPPHEGMGLKFLPSSDRQQQKLLDLVARLAARGKGKG